MREKALDQLTLNRLYLVLAIAIVIAVSLWAGSDAVWIRTWMPHIAAEAGGALVTVAFVNFILGRRRRPLLGNAAARIEAPLYSLFQVIMNQRTRMYGTVDQKTDPKEMFADWEAELQTQLPERDWLTYWSKNLESAASSLRVARDRYDRFLDERLLAALDSFDLWSARSASEVRWTVTLDNAVESRFPTPTWTPTYLDHFSEAGRRIGDIVDAFGAQFSRPLLLTADMWRAARAHRHSQIAGLPLAETD